jgi:hypothetical protein
MLIILVGCIIFYLVRRRQRQQLPDDVIGLIFEMTSGVSLARMSQVSKAWNEICVHELSRPAASHRVGHQCSVLVWDNPRRSLWQRVGTIANDPFWRKWDEKISIFNLVHVDSATKALTSRGQREMRRLYKAAPRGPTRKERAALMLRGFLPDWAGAPCVAQCPCGITPS